MAGSELCPYLSDSFLLQDLELEHFLIFCILICVNQSTAGFFSSFSLLTVFFEFVGLSMTELGRFVVGEASVLASISSLRGLAGE